jgi:RNA polymerase sigma factor (sigma-70 family)
MGYTDRFPGLDERSRKQLIFRSRSLIGHYGFIGEDIEDIQQELYLHLSQQLPNYDPKRSSKSTFVDRVLTSGSRDLIRRQTAMKRDYRLCQTSLDQSIFSTDEGETSLGDSICEAQHAFDTGQSLKSDPDKIDLRIDVQRVLAKLDRMLRLICLGLAAQKTPTEISRELGICRQTFYDCRARIREAFEAAGMGVYVAA